MIELFCPFYAEGKEIIEYYQLKKTAVVQGIDSFENAERTLRLTITGTGKIACACTVSLILEHSKDSFALLYGCAASMHKVHEPVYIANQIKDIDTNRFFYPDMCLHTKIKETGFMTGSVVFHWQDEESDTAFHVYDMESSAFYEAASRTLGPHQIACIRFISDSGETGILTKDDILQKAHAVFPLVRSYIDRILSSCPSKESQSIPEIVKQFEEHIHATVTMRKEIEQYVCYCMLAEIDFETPMKEILAREVKDKEQGKECYHVFINQCIQS